MPLPHNPAPCHGCPLESARPAKSGGLGESGGLGAPDQALPSQTLLSKAAQACLRSIRRPPCAFNAWAYFFGPLYYLVWGIWRKGLLLGLVWALSFAGAFSYGFFLPAFADGEAELYHALLDVYSGLGLVLAVLAFFFPLLIGKGKVFAAIFVVLLAALVVLLADTLLPRLDLGGFSALFWFATVPVWNALAASLFLCALSLRYALCFAFGLVALFLFLAGPPIPDFVWFDLPQRLLAVFCGLAAPRDFCRSRLLRERFWW